jgi:hypothetical protein
MRDAASIAQSIWEHFAATDRIRVHSVETAAHNPNPAELSRKAAPRRLNRFQPGSSPNQPHLGGDSQSASGKTTVPCKARVT